MKKKMRFVEGREGFEKGRREKKNMNEWRDEQGGLPTMTIPTPN
jgi:hypothetical protein